MVNRWIEALKDYNAGKNTWCIPRKNSRDYNAIMSALKGVKKLNIPVPVPIPQPVPQPPSVPRPSFIRPTLPPRPPSVSSQQSQRVRILKKYDAFGKVIPQS